MRFIILAMWSVKINYSTLLIIMCYYIATLTHHVIRDRYLKSCFLAIYHACPLHMTTTCSNKNRTAVEGGDNTAWLAKWKVKSIITIQWVICNWLVKGCQNKRGIIMQAINARGSHVMVTWYCLSKGCLRAGPWLVFPKTHMHGWGDCCNAIVAGCEFLPPRLHF